ncbi:hypothetical protein [Agrobacterium rosae]|uniref:Uncharacterized protein n=1 Tax=Agrobacterium rosae TaxID=1972867 RepID=A0ABU4W2B5_9HYPH|nr:hypothetical protein [Agrobacterium rosae]MDX8331925.1 hypothetical protein [Agrobacterium rosae]
MNGSVKFSRRGETVENPIPNTNLVELQNLTGKAFHFTLLPAVPTRFSPPDQHCHNEQRKQDKPCQRKGHEQRGVTATFFQAGAQWPGFRHDGHRKSSDKTTARNTCDQNQYVGDSSHPPSYGVE